MEGRLHLGHQPHKRVEAVTRCGTAQHSFCQLGVLLDLGTYLLDIICTMGVSERFATALCANWCSEHTWSQCGVAVGWSKYVQ